MRIALCGSTRFKRLFEDWNHQLAVSGHTVYSLSLFGITKDDDPSKAGPLISDEDKIILDLVHLDKILNSDAIVVVTDETFYIGDSTRREIAWARLQKKRVYWAENLHDAPLSTNSGEPWAGCLLREYRGSNTIYPGK